MSKKLIVAGIIASGLYALTKIFRRKSHDENDLDSSTHEVVVKEINGEWRVVLADNENESDVYANRGDYIIWEIIGSDVTFKFPKRGIFGFRDKDEGQGKFKARIRRFSPKGIFIYDVIIKKTGTKARGQSPPRIIVKE